MQRYCFRKNLQYTASDLHKVPGFFLQEYTEYGNSTAKPARTGYSARNVPVLL